MALLKLWMVPKKIQWAVSLFGFSIFFFIAFLIKVPINGDTFYYAQSIIDFGSFSIHYGYFVLGSLLYFVFEKFGTSPLETLTYLSVLSGAICVVGMFLFSFELTQNYFHALLSSLTLLFSGAFWIFTEHGEVYVPQLALVLLSLQTIMWKLPLFSSLLFLFSVSITPTSCLALPALVYLMVYKKFKAKQIVYFGIPLVASFLIVIVLGLSIIKGVVNWAIYSPSVFIHPFSFRTLLSWTVYHVLKVYGKSFNLFSFLAIIGFILIWLREKKLFLLVIAFLMPFGLYLLNLGLLSEDHLIITFIPVSFLASYGLVYIFRSLNFSTRTYALTVIPIMVFYSFISYQIFISPALRDSEEQMRVINMLNAEFETNSIMISDYNFGTAFWYLTQKEKNHFLLSGRPNCFLERECLDHEMCLKRLETKFWVNISHLPGTLSQIEHFKEYALGRPVFFVDRLPWRSRLAQHLVFKGVIGDEQQMLYRSERLGKYLSKNFGYEVKFIKLIDSPLYPVYKMLTAP